MKKNRLFLALLAFACTSFFACSSSDDETTDPGVGAETGSDIGEDAAGSRFMSVQIINPAGTKATDGGYEKGSDDENKVNSLRFYFFNEDGSPITVNATAGAGGDKNFVSATPEPVGENMPNVEKILKATVVINTKQGDNINVKKVVAVANYDIAGLDDAAKSLSDLCAAVGDYSKISITNGGTTANNNFLMTSSSYADGSGQVTAVDIKPENLCNSAAAAEANPVSIYIERVVAKVKMDLSWKESVETEKDVTFNGETVTAVKMKNAEGKNIIVNIDGTDKQLYVVFNKWDITGTAPQSYLIKKVGSTTAWNGLFTGWNDPGKFRSYWAENPAGVTNMDLKHFNYQSIGQKFNGGYVYCLENAGDDGVADGTKAVYDPKATITNRTQAIIAATLVTLDGKNATAIGLVNWAGQYYTEAAAITRMLDAITTKVYTDAEHTTKIAASDVELVTATAAHVADANSETSPRYYSYLQLTSTAESKTFYDANGNTIDNNAKVNEILKSLPGAKVWHDGLTYYYTDIEHFGADDTKGKYGVVRNHVYEISINSVVGLGTPVLKTDEVIVPQKPENVDTYIAAQINILSWRIVKQSVDLEW